MQVSQIIELDTHAVIGGGKARAFSMADSPEFFQVLSSTLYRDKKRAVIREVVCNAWDAHIISDQTDRYVEVTTTDGQMTIRDFGPGIPDHLIVPIYCVYGASTKVKSDKETGGFGLGSKAPFAYTDHFTVTSCHAGTKNVYALSRGGAATDGKPEIRTMVSVPTTESGITVTFPLQTSEDKAEFEAILRSVVYQGGMKVNLNGLPLDTIDYTPAREQGFCTIYNRNWDMNESAVYLLYGTVLYPVTTTDARVSKAVTEAGALIASGFKLVLIAPPNSVGVTPSRESLSYSELTTATILRLLRRAINTLTPAIQIAGKRLYSEFGKRQRLRRLEEPSKRKLPSIHKTLCIDPLEIAHHAIKDDNKSVQVSNIRKHYYSGVIATNSDARVLLRRARAQQLAPDRVEAEYAFDRALRMVKKLGMFDKAMFYNDCEHYDGSRRMTTVRSNTWGHEVWKPKLSGSVYVAPNQRELTSLIVGAKGDPTERNEEIILGFVVGNNPSSELTERIRTVAEKFNFMVEQYDFDYVKPKIVRTKRPPELFQNFDDYLEDRELLEGPKLESARFFMVAYNHAGTVKIGIDDRSVRHGLSQLYPGIAVVTTKEQAEKLRNMGAVNILEEITNRLAAMTRRREVQYGLLLHDQAFISGSYAFSAQYNLRELVNGLAGKHIDIAKLLFPDRVTLGEDWKVAKLLIRAIRGFPGNQGLEFRFAREGKPKKGDTRLLYPEDVIDEITNRARETFKHLLVDIGEIEKTFGYLSMLVNSNWVRSHEILKPEQRQQLISVIRHLQRLSSKSTLIDNQATNMKEAA